MITHPQAPHHHPQRLRFPTISEIPMVSSQRLLHLPTVVPNAYGSNGRPHQCYHHQSCPGLGWRHDYHQDPLEEVQTTMAYSPMSRLNLQRLFRYRKVRSCSSFSHDSITNPYGLIGDDTYVVPEDTRQEAPPSYASAQADAVPPYWETTVHAPFAPDSIGDMVIDNLPTGSLFSFCWNLLVSISFQFIGFLLTYLLHTSHAARLGSRAGLGVTLIQYGFALRSRMESPDGTGNGDWMSDSQDGSSKPEDGRPMHHHPDMTNVTWGTPAGNMTEEQVGLLVAESTTEWLSFFLMTIGE